MAPFTEHHIALSVRDLESALKFYGYFGFRLCAKWTAGDDSLIIAHAKRPDGTLVLEFFNYADNSTKSRLSPGVGNDLGELGVKHFGFTVDDLNSVRDQMVKDGHQGMTEIIHGRTRIDYFFVPDPDGNWVEVVHEDRNLDPDRPIIMREGE